jgi:hypothetical protein
MNTGDKDMITLEEIRRSAAEWDGFREMDRNEVGNAILHLVEVVRDAAQESLRPWIDDNVVLEWRSQCRTALDYLDRLGKVPEAPDGDLELFEATTSWCLFVVRNSLTVAVESDEVDLGNNVWKENPINVCDTIVGLAASAMKLWLQGRGYRLSPGLVGRVLEICPGTDYTRFFRSLENIPISQ